MTHKIFGNSTLPPSLHCRRSLIEPSGAPANSILHLYGGGRKHPLRYRHQASRRKICWRHYYTSHIGGDLHCATEEITAHCAQAPYLDKRGGAKPLNGV